MSEQNLPLKIQKRLLQFNNLPIAYGEIDEQTYTASFKGEVQAYTNHQHGGYYPHLGEYGVLNVSQFDATIVFSFKDIACGDKPRYARFIKRQLAKSGKLWAVHNGGEIIWANARVVSVNESVAVPGDNTVRMAVTFELIDGYWVLAWKTRTFIAPYCVSRFINFDDQYCWSYEDAKCDITGQDRCLPCFKYEPELNTDADYKPLCSYSRSELSDMLAGRCPQQFHIRYDCDLEKQWFCYDASWGNKYRMTNKNRYNTTTIDFCSMTDLPTNLIQIRLRGNYTDPTIRVNDDEVTVKGVFPEGTALFVGFGVGVGRLQRRDDADGRFDYRYVGSEINNATMTNIPYFQLNPGKNTISISGNAQDRPSFAYIKPIEITF